MQGPAQEASDLMPEMIEAIEIDEQADAGYVRVSTAAVARTEEVSDGLILDLDRDDEVVGIEVLGLSRRVSGSDPQSYLRGLFAGLRVRPLHATPG
jgi:uncharacterized protein YuzE